MSGRGPPNPAVGRTRLPSADRAVEPQARAATPTNPLPTTWQPPSSARNPVGRVVPRSPAVHPLGVRRNPRAAQVNPAAERVRLIGRTVASQERPTPAGSRPRLPPSVDSRIARPKACVAAVNVAACPATPRPQGRPALPTRPPPTMRQPPSSVRCRRTPDSRTLPDPEVHPAERDPTPPAPPSPAAHRLRVRRNPQVARADPGSERVRPSRTPVRGGRASWAGDRAMWPANNPAADNLTTRTVALSAAAHRPGARRNPQVGAAELRWPVRSVGRSVPISPVGGRTM